MSIPKLDLSTFFLSISAAAMQSLQASPPDKDMAKHNIDLLEMLQDKTKGNLSPEETQLLEHVLFQLRMSFVKGA
jgi:hypothetical protein